MTFNKTFILAIAGSLGLSACVDNSGGYYGGQPQTNNARNAAIAGAVVGGVLGATADGDERLTKAAAGAIAGAAIGGVAGSLLDRQAQELQGQLGNGTTVTNTGSNLVVNMPESVLFAVDSATVSQASVNNLYTLADSLNRYPNTSVQVVGHTDSTGSEAYNQDLSQRRASAVAQVLRGNGVAPGRITFYGQGESRPVASNATESGRAQNRRVEIIITPNQ